jgi:regulator of protease activity HflC (stomatin/prohibitin superfamily)
MQTSSVVELFGLVVLFIIVLSILSRSVFTVRTQTVAIIERFGKYTRVATAGFNITNPFFETTREVSLETLQLEGSIQTKTKDNVFVTLPVTVQYSVGQTDDEIRNAYYKLSRPQSQMTAYLNNILLGHIPSMDLDELFISQVQVSKRATDELSAEMQPFGYQIVKVLITDIKPDPGVVAAMNRINEETRNLAANKAQGDAEYVLKVRQAEADAEVKRLEGVGVAQERMAIADGWEESIKKIKAGTNLDDNAATGMLLFTNYTDAMKSIGESKNTTMVFLPSSPDAISSFQSALTNALLLGNDKKLG